MLRDMNDADMPRLPKSAPTGFIRERGARHVLPGGAIDRRYYALCVLSELRNRLRAGDVWVVGSRRYRSFEERLISRQTQQELQQNTHWDLPIAPRASSMIGSWSPSRLVAAHVSRWLVVAQADIDHLAQQIVLGPGQKLDLHDELGANPMHAAEHQG